MNVESINKSLERLSNEISTAEHVFNNAFSLSRDENDKKPELSSQAFALKKAIDFTEVAIDLYRSIIEEQRRAVEEHILIVNERNIYNEITTKKKKYPVEKTKIDRPWSEYPIGTKAFASSGGHWEKVKCGWKWSSGATFQIPGGDAFAVSVPEEY